LQQPRTNFPDENIFITYHQITELYFKLILQELQQIAQNPRNVVFVCDRMRRINRYFAQLIGSFDVMVEGMDREQFLQFRMALLPASGFQSVQIRMIEMASTQFVHLTKNPEILSQDANATLDDLYPQLYWKKGASEIDTGKKTLTLLKFEAKYDKLLMDFAKNHTDTNLCTIVQNLPANDPQMPELVAQLRQYDLNVNVRWKLMHLKSAMRYLQTPKQTVAATGGTNWQQYLPPRHQRQVFFKHLWTDTELDNWGRSID
jgi:tryptophan 2,3-dioxygenase